MQRMNPKHKVRHLCECIGAILCLLIFMTAGIVLADVTVPITPKNLPKTDATLTFAFTGEVTGLTVVTPDGRTLSGTPSEAGKIYVYLGDAPAGAYTLTIAGTFTTFNVSVSGSVAETSAAATTAMPTPTPTLKPTPIPQETATESGSVVTPIPTPTPTIPPAPPQTAGSTDKGPATTSKNDKDPAPTTATVTPLPIILVEETTTTTAESAKPEETVPAPTQDKIDEFISTNIPTPQILVESESYFSLMMIYAVIPLVIGGGLGAGCYIAFGFYSIYNRKKRRLKEEEEAGIQLK